MSNYYFLSGKVNKQSVFAYSVIDADPDLDLLPKLLKKDKLNFSFILKPKKINTGTSNKMWSDYQPNNYAWPLMSEKLMAIINEKLTGKEKIIWMSVFVKYKTEKRQYYIPRFEKKLDLINKNKTIYGYSKKSIICPVFSMEKIQSFSMFYTPQVYWQISPSLFVNEEIKISIEEAKLVGINFSRAAVL